ncbi:aspartate aminotransferase family protein, partial [Candidatus Woesearchaeota archaeon]|nr:aspartate aminotransferase family protein [Candidatus Woesearchaeota archaeon]
AALATITKLEKINAPEVFKRIGKNMHNEVQNIITDFELDDIVSMTGVDWWPRFSVDAYGDNSQIEMTTLLRQELIKQGIFIGGGFNLSIAHDDDDIISDTLYGVRQSFEKFSTYLKAGNPMSNLQGELIKPVFQVRST